MAKNHLVVERVYAELRSAIVTCEYPPGQPVTEVELAARYQVSRTPIREVCIRLMRDDLLEYIPHKGYSVSQVRLGDLHNLYDVRLMLEPNAAKLAARRASPASISELWAKVQVIKESTKDGDFIGRIVAEKEFHRLIAEAGGNNRLAKIIADVGNQIERLIHFLYRNHSYDLQPCHEEHSSILKAIEERNASLAREAMAELVAGHKRRALQALAGEVAVSHS